MASTVVLGCPSIKLSEKDLTFYPESAVIVLKCCLLLIATTNNNKAKYLCTTKFSLTQLIKVQPQQFQKRSRKRGKPNYG